VNITDLSIGEQFLVELLPNMQRCAGAHCLHAAVWQRLGT